MHGFMNISRTLKQCKNFFQYVWSYISLNAIWILPGKLTWLFIIMITPVPGTILLWFTKKDIGNLAMKERLNYIIGETRYKLPQDGKVINNPDIVNSMYR